MESIFTVGNLLFMGGEDTGLLSVNISNDK